MKFAEKKRDPNFTEEQIPGELVPIQGGSSQAQDILEEVAQWLGFQDTWQYNHACELKQNFKARRRLRRKKVK